MARDEDRATSKSKVPSKPNPFEDSIEGDRDGLKRNPPRKARRLVLREDTPSPPRKSPTPPPPKKHKASTGESSSRASKGRGPAAETVPRIEPPPAAQANEELALALPPRPYPFSEPLHFENEEHQARLEHIESAKKIVIPTSYPDWALLDNLQIGDEVRRKLSGCGLGFFLMDDPGCYERLVKEFLCSFEAERRGKLVVKWRFILGGEEFEVDYGELQKWLGLPPSLPGQPVYDGLDRTKFWKRISGRNEWFDSSYSSAEIRDPIWKVIHHLIAIGINTRGGLAQVVTTPDLKLLMLIEYRIRNDWITVFAESFEGFMRKSSRTITLRGGSLITLIAINCNFSFAMEEPSRKILDLDIMRRDHFLKPGTMLWDHDDKPHLEEVQKKARRSKAAYLSRHRDCTLTPSPPPSPGPSVPPPPSESIPPSSADWTSQFERLSADVADMRIGMSRLEEFTHRESQFHRQEAQWVRSTLTSIVQNMSSTSSSASAPPPPPFEHAPPSAPDQYSADPSRPFGFPPPFAPAPRHAQPPPPIGFAPPYAPAPSRASPLIPAASFLAEEDSFASPDDDDDTPF